MTRNPNAIRVSGSRYTPLYLEDGTERDPEAQYTVSKKSPLENALLKHSAKSIRGSEEGKDQDIEVDHPSFSNNRTASSIPSNSPPPPSTLNSVRALKDFWSGQNTKNFKENHLSNVSKVAVVVDDAYLIPLSSASPKISLVNHKVISHISFVVASTSVGPVVQQYSTPNFDEVQRDLVHPPKEASVEGERLLRLEARRKRLLESERLQIKRLNMKCRKERIEVQRYFSPSFISQMNFIIWNCMSSLA